MSRLQTMPGGHVGPEPIANRFGEVNPNQQPLGSGGVIANWNEPEPLPTFEEFIGGIRDSLKSSLGQTNMNAGAPTLAELFRTATPKPDDPLVINGVAVQRPLGLPNWDAQTPPDAPARVPIGNASQEPNWGNGVLKRPAPPQAALGLPVW